MTYTKHAYYSLLKVISSLIVNRYKIWPLVMAGVMVPEMMKVVMVAEVMAMVTMAVVVMSVVIVAAVMRAGKAIYG